MPYEKNKTAYQDEEWFERAKRRVSEKIEQRILFLIWSREHPPLRVLFFYAFF